MTAKGKYNPSLLLKIHLFISQQDVLEYRDDLNMPHSKLIWRFSLVMEFIVL